MTEYIILGIIQGIFEWLPISSEGITSMFSQFFLKGLNPVDVALFLHLGTLLAVLVYFRKEWGMVFMGKDNRLLRFLIISTFVSLAIGFPVYKTITNFATGYTLLLITGLGLLFTSFFQRNQRKEKMKEEKTAVFTGILQGLAVIPGLSRSGSTIFGLSLGGFSPREVLKISYMMSAPVVLVANFYIFLMNPNLVSNGWVSLVFSFLTGLISLKLLLGLAKRVNFSRFTLFFGFLCILGALIGFIF